MDQAPDVLIVEDNVDLAEITCEVLSTAGACAIYRTSVADALDALARHAGTIRVLIADINLATPMSGIDLVVYVAEEWPTVAICVVSGDTARRPPRLPSKALFLAKPWRTAELLAFVREAGAAPGTTDASAV